MYYKCERFQPAQGLKLNGLNGEIEQGANGEAAHAVWPFRPFSLAIQTIQFVAPMQFETFPIYI